MNKGHPSKVRECVHNKRSKILSKTGYSIRDIILSNTFKG
ncbi:hypothetical protein IMCC14465_15010 [alpha proteobacterium IMCC14465]|uniref:Uncharacterized protein n=1 Tax=alpha proteobacterium IMCC14465 TaxID=1220535 RepID=J9DF20_9PROT|nr:hypothetical protein IMCC14465_15010 [alpha proteobacterium IMCC14465]